MAGVAGALFGAASSMASGTDFQMFESLLIGAVVALGGASVCSGALAGGLDLGFLPGTAQDVFIGAGTVAPAFSPDGVLPLGYAQVRRWWDGLGVRRDAGRRDPGGPAGSPGPAPGAPGPAGAGERRGAGGDLAGLTPGGGGAARDQALAIVGTPGDRYHGSPAMCGPRPGAQCATWSSNFFVER